MLRSVRLSPGVSVRQDRQTTRQPGHASDNCSPSGALQKHSRDRTTRAHACTQQCGSKQQAAVVVAGTFVGANIVAAPYVIAAEALETAEALEVVEQAPPVQTSVAVEDATSLLDSAPAGALDAVDAVQDATSAAAAAVANATEETVDAIAAAASAVTSAASDATSSVSAVVSGATSAVFAAASDVTTAATDATSAVTTAASEATAAVTGTLAKAVGSATDALDAVGSTVGEATAGITATAGSAVAAVTSVVDAGVTAVTGATSSVQSALVSSVDAATAATSSAVASAVGQLPPEAQAALSAVPRGLGVAADFVAAYPLPIAVGAVAVAVPLTMQYLNERYGGYAGELEPYEAYDVLLNEDAVLVDIRSETERSTWGLPELKYQSRFKATVWEPLSVDPVLLKRAANSKALELEVNAAYLSGIKLVKSPLTKLIILDSAGSDSARDLARALRSVGIASPYVVSGGFRAWMESGLGVNAGGALVYEGNVVEYIQDELELLGQQVLESARPLQDPIVATSAGAGLIAAAVAIYNYKTTLEWIGVLGLMASATNFVLKYDSPEALAADVQRTWGKLTSGLQASAPKKSITPVIQPIVPATPAAGKREVFSNGASTKEAKAGDMVPAVSADGGKDADKAPGTSSTDA